MDFLVHHLLQFRSVHVHRLLQILLELLLLLPGSPTGLLLRLIGIVEEFLHSVEVQIVRHLRTQLLTREEGEEVGKWGEGTTEGAPVPEEE